MFFFFCFLRIIIYHKYLLQFNLSITLFVLEEIFVSLVRDLRNLQENECASDVFFCSWFFLISVCIYVCFECTGSVYRSFFHFHHKICVMKSTFLIQIGLYFNLEQFGVFREQGGSGSDYFLVYFYLVRHLIHSFAFVFFTTILLEGTQTFPMERFVFDLMFL